MDTIFSKQTSKLMGKVNYDKFCLKKRFFEVITLTEGKIHRKTFSRLSNQWLHSLVIA